MIRKTKLFMDTVVDICVVSAEPGEYIEQKINRAFDAFRKVEDAFSRFSPDSELMLASKHCNRNRPISVSPFLFEPLKFALEMAKYTEGIFDPTVGRWMEEQGFNRHYLTGQRMESEEACPATYQDIILNEQDQTLFLLKPLVIDLGAVAKGFAIDLAASELREFNGFVVNAGVIFLQGE